MSTQAYSFNTDHQTDAAFRLWGADLNAKLAAVGLTNTADTGQVNWTTVTRPGINTNGGYEIWRFNDTAHAAAPIFIRLDYGTGGVATRPRLQLTVGTGSSGAGVITGSVLAATTISAGTGTSTGSPFTNYLNYNATKGFLALVQGAGGALAGLALGGFFIARTCDSAGDPDVTGCLIGYHSLGSALTADANFIPVRFAATAAVYQNITGCAFLTPTNEITSAVGSDLQNFLAFAPFPRILPMQQVCSTLISELPDGSTATMQTVGASSYTFLSVGRQLGEVAAAVSTTIQSRFGLTILFQ